MKKLIAVTAALLLTGSLASAKDAHKKKTAAPHTTGMATNANHAAKNTNSETTPTGGENPKRNTPSAN